MKWFKVTLKATIKIGNVEQFTDKDVKTVQASYCQTDEGELLFYRRNGRDSQPHCRVAAGQWVCVEELPGDPPEV